jgi:LmbE family N-acetylglucosaminyl deacetylase
VIPAKKILVLSPHPDDGEFGCGASVARYLEAGAEVSVLVFSLCEESLPKNFSVSDIKKELLDSWTSLGVSEGNVFVSDYQVRRFSEKRQEILEELVARKLEFNPDLVFLPTTQDIHQDHQVIATEGFRAFKQITVLGYELAWNTVAFPTQAFIALNQNQLKLKAKALEKYKSQKSRQYFDEDFVKSLAQVRGVQAGKKYAEAFEVLRIVQ